MALYPLRSPHALTGPISYGCRFNVVVYTAIFTVVVLVGLDTYVDDVDPATGKVLPMKFIQTCDCFLLEVGLWS